MCKVEDEVNNIKDNNITIITKYYLENFPIFGEDFINKKMTNITVIFLNFICFF